MPISENATNTVASAERRAGGSRLRRFAVQHPVASYLGLSFGIGWSILFPLAIAGLPVEPGLIALVFLGQLGPAMLISAAEGGRPAVRELLSRTFRWRVHPGWYIAAVFALPVMIVLGAVVARGASPVQALIADPGVITSYLAALAIIPLINLWEETGWMFAQTRLEERHGALLGATITAVFFGALHIPLYLDMSSARNTALLTLLGLAVAVPFRVVIGWLYRHTGSSVLLVAIFHGSFNASNSESLAAAVAPGAEPLLLVGLALTALAAAVVWDTRSSQRR